MRFLEMSRPLMVIIGPTAVGKTDFSLRLAERLDAEIVSADSRLFYRGMDIGTAKPTPEERRGVPHHLIDVSDPDQVWSLTIFQQAAEAAITDIQARGKLPILVGGTGQYVHAVMEGWLPPATAPVPHLRDALLDWGKQIGPLELHNRLRLLDPEAADRIEPFNMRRTIRAFEVILSTGHKFSGQIRRTSSSPYTLMQIGIKRPRPELYARIDARIQAMLEQGLLQEVQALLDKGYSPDLPTMSAIGYREMIAHLQGRMTLDEAVMWMKRLTREFVRRQANWFKEDDPAIHWFEASAVRVEDVLALLEKDFYRPVEG
jgi:tRNA dimethylallyltransferase